MCMVYTCMQIIFTMYTWIFQKVVQTFAFRAV